MSPCCSRSIILYYSQTYCCPNFAVASVLLKCLHAAQDLALDKTCLLTMAGLLTAKNKPRKKIYIQNK